MESPPAPKVKRDCCTGIIDGETILVTKADGKLVNVRLIGVRTPGEQAQGAASPNNATVETGKQGVAAGRSPTTGTVTQSAATRDSIALAKVARDFRQEPARFMASFILHEQVTLELDPALPDGSNGNMLAYVYRHSDSTQLNEALILNGLGVVQPEPKFGKLEQFYAAERVARSRLTGYWRKLKDHEEQRRLIREINERRAKTWLKMGDNLKETNVKATRKYYNDVLKTYPDSESATLARERLKTLPK